MKFISLEKRSDFSLPAFFAGWAVLAMLPGLIVWMLGIGVPRIEYFPAPVVSVVTYQSAAYASIVTAFGLALLAAFRLAAGLRVKSISPFWRSICLLGALAAPSLTGGFNPFEYNNIVTRVLYELVAIGDWVTVSLMAISTSFGFAVCMALCFAKAD